MSKANASRRKWYPNNTIMAKYLKVSFPENCIGCELCIAETQRQLQKVGLDGAPIRVLKKQDTDTLAFIIEIDPRINNFDIEKIKEICPTQVFTLEDKEDQDGLVS